MLVGGGGDGGSCTGITRPLKEGPRCQLPAIIKAALPCLSLIMFDLANKASVCHLRVAEGAPWPPPSFRQTSLLVRWTAHDKKRARAVFDVMGAMGVDVDIFPKCHRFYSETPFMTLSNIGFFLL